jgi:C1A family cysteine protease
MLSSRRKFAYKFQKKDERDYTIKVVDDKIVIKTSKSTTTNSVSNLHPTFTISYLGNILDQGDIGSCTCNSAALIINTMTKNSLNLSRLFLYALCRIYDNSSLDQDCGTTIRTVCNIIQNYGFCLEKIYPYNTILFSKFPPLNTFKSSNLLKKFTYYAVNQDLQSLKQCLITYNEPITFGILIYDSFMTASVASTGIVPMPDTTKEELQGGHCVTMIGYNDNTSSFICANSWGTNWGNKGLFYLPYAYVLDKNLSSDFFRYSFIY